MKIKTQGMFIVALALITSVFLVHGVLAENETNLSVNNSVTSLDNASVQDINDDLNESVTGFKMFKEKMGLWFTFSQEKKAEKELKLARLELIRAKLAANNNNTVAVEKALDAHERLIEKVKARVNKIDGKADREGIKDSVSKLVGLERAIEVHEAHIQRLNDLIANNSNLSEEQIAKIQEKIEKIENNTAKLKEIEADKKDKFKTKLMAITNMSEEEASAEIQNLEDAKNLSAVKRMVAVIKVANAEKQLENFKEKVAEKNTTKFDSKISELESNIAEAKSLIEQGNYSQVNKAFKKAEVQRKEIAKENRDNFREKVQKFKEDRKQNRENKQADDLNESEDALNQSE